MTIVSLANARELKSSMLNTPDHFQLCFFFIRSKSCAMQNAYVDNIASP